MKKTRFTESQIIKVLHEDEAGRKAEDICRELDISRATFYRWKSQYGEWRPLMPNSSATSFTEPLA